MLQNQNSNQVMFSFLRHAQTYYNVRTDQVRTKYNDQNIQDNPQYKKVRYEKSFMDCSITQEGHAQCQKISKILEKQEFDLVIISPMRRALETCHHILANIRATKNIKFIVEPLITQRISSACNISSRISESIRDFEYINFDAVKDKTEDWYLQILPNEIKNKIIQAKQCQQNKQICDLTLQLIKKYGSLEKNQNLMVRAKKARLRLFQLKKQFGAKKVLVIGHSIFFKYLLASGKNENGSIQNQPIMRNCQIIKKAITYQN